MSPLLEVYLLCSFLVVASMVRWQIRKERGSGPVRNGWRRWKGFRR